ncbi:MAG: UDP-N-acetylmuramoyl-L-alanyl-D-glutamate--2,6-diaminopimelate ligase, partial [Baekduia sp.]|nr:UDP-N-acetylmuramoyl-L-alanyl-D-glutamate--2,6-diaminopimelate ligase [Baekduia sp.]
MVAAMLLGDLFEDTTLPEVDVHALAFDARTVEPGTAFFCVRGFTADGHDFAPDAVARGAAALVVDHPLGLGIPEIDVPDVRAAMAPAAARLAGDPTAELAMVGITGTNGKTTTSYLTRALLEAAGRQTGLIGTVTSWVGGTERPVVRTTPEAIDLQRTFRAMRDGGDVAAVMEVSSHAMALHRADAIHWDVVAFTNLTQDHLDFHVDMEDYFQAKRRLFEVAAAQGATLVACVDDPYGARLAQEFAGTVTFGIDAAADYRATGIQPGFAGSRFTAVTPDGEFETGNGLPGRFNVLNALGAWAAARALGVPPEAIA